MKNTACMSPKERLLASLRGKETDRLAWSPFLAYLWDTLPQSIQDDGQLAFLEEIGSDPLLRGSHQLYSIRRNKCTIKEISDGQEKEIIYDTPVGSLKARYRFSTAGNTWFVTGHPVKTKEDFKVLLYINEDMKIVPDMRQFETDIKRTGDRGLYVPIIGTEHKSAFQSLLEYWVGTEELVFAISDFPEAVEECLQVMRLNSAACVEISVQSSAEAFIFWEDSSTTNISPAYFEKYSAPEISQWSSIIHRAEKLLIHHACGHLKGLLGPLVWTGIDALESVSPPPTGNVELWEVREKIGGEVALIGGIEPTVFLNSSIDELKTYLNILLEKMERKRFILANSDSCPPGVSIEKLKLVSSMVKTI